jgi:hypothetical protein
MTNLAEYVTAREVRLRIAAEKMAAHDLEISDHQEPLDFYEALAEIAAGVFFG